MVASLPSDKVQVTALALPVRLTTGDHWSRPSQPAPHLLSFTLHHSLAASGSTDTLPSTINYSSASKAVVKAVDARDWPSLETCAAAAVGELRGMGANGTVEVKLEAQKLLVAGRTGVSVISERVGGEEQRRMDINEIVVRCIVGVNPQERVEKQLVHLDLSFPLPATADVGFPHAKFAEAAHDHVLPTSFGTIEALAQSLADHLLSFDVAPHPPLEQLTVRVSKPHALTFAKYASVEVTRARGSSEVVGPAGGQVGPGATRAVIALGSNIGDRIGHINRAVDLLIKTDGAPAAHETRLIQTSWLYESEPMYVEDQDRFANGAVLISTTLSPTALLTHLKYVEKTIGRKQTFRNGPRVVDLDLVLYGDSVVDVDTPEGGLKVPHVSLVEREFVLRPLMDIVPDWVHPGLHLPVSTLYSALPPSSPPVLNRILPFPAPSQPLLSNPRLRTRTLIMSILNATPDSFSDGGSYTSVDAAVNAARQMVADGADILDVGGLSTRPGSAPISAEDEAARVVPVIHALREAGVDIPISVDTYRAHVARAAVEAGANCINDVYGGRDEGMLEFMAAANVPVVLMHSRGDSASMSSLTQYDDDDVVSGVLAELVETVNKALAAGVKRWNIILDPGIGFAKNGAQNLALLAALSKLTAADEISPLAGYPQLVGASRKRFIGDLTGQADPKARGYGTAAVTAACVQSGAVDIVRVHDTRETRDFVRVLEAIRAAER